MVFSPIFKCLASAVAKGAMRISSSQDCHKTTDQVQFTVYEFGLNIYERPSGQTVTEAFPQRLALNSSPNESSAFQADIASMSF